MTRHAFSSGKFYATVALLAGISIAFQYGCTSARPPGATRSPRSLSSPARPGSATGNGNVAARDAMAQKMQRLKRPENIDEFFANLRYLVYNDMIRDPAFYESDEYLLKALGAKSIQDPAVIDDLGLYSISLKMGNLPDQRCAIYKFRDGGINFDCRPEALLYIYAQHSSSRENLPLSKIRQDELVDVIYEKFRSTFGQGWQYTDTFTHKNRASPSKFGSHMFQKHIRSGGTDYAVTTGYEDDYSAFGGIAISELKPQPPAFIPACAWKTSAVACDILPGYRKFFALPSPPQATGHQIQIPPKN